MLWELTRAVGCLWSISELYGCYGHDSALNCETRGMVPFQRVSVPRFLLSSDQRLTSCNNAGIPDDQYVIS
jgi:hypothetical protein